MLTIFFSAIKIFHCLCYENLLDAKNLYTLYTPSLALIPFTSTLIFHIVFIIRIIPLPFSLLYATKWTFNPDKIWSA